MCLQIDHGIQFLYEKHQDYYSQSSTFFLTNVVLDRIRVLFEGKMKMLRVTNTWIMNF